MTAMQVLPKLEFLLAALMLPVLAGVGLAMVLVGGSLAGFARIRAAIGIRQETHGARDQPIV